ncbi:MULTISPECIES: restriction endonuclease subunit S [unclassified Paenibacillus]|uniref:restriction endonuclease subunit S n=1 Tax=unclassified Paenibacillus TaxID=185978 RepID=UPI002406E54A|nr:MULTISPECIES: restriction endonuclease subunit S [unclassified Paenibacillus]MDF9845014.1 type I restriction enzyme S subunit [Paenibacillus sp. PastF-2]MDF9851613.1 type I restriction enzyme S subunit [Paenibacillus sp. PastM-2]MDF9858197.1 type I restriction enzyme S subunit [Paenibacillus sp. PastF-1]MDH6483456.1 type I restriction enzyme S subunit [Paenibacillus sp. PastH-2]MDH6510868.1 type I restriction enzyme S subunit [Paenibacillus sp. PastM-3]
MNSEYSKKSLGDCVSIITGFPFKSEDFNTDEKGIRLVRGKNVTKGSLRWGEDTRYWSNVSDDLLKYKLLKDDIVIGMDGSLVGRNYAKISEKDLPLLLVQRVAALRALNNIRQEYVYFLIDNERFINYIDSIKTGTSIPHISVKQIKNFEVLLPSLEEQNQIISILQPLYDKIELNNAINKNLEEMAQALFKRWFVDFEFPNENGEPYKSSDGEFEESELGFIPKGWTLKPIYDMADFINGTSFKADEIGGAGVPIIKIAELKSGITQQTKFYQAMGKDGKYYLDNGDILFSWSGNPDTSIDTFIWYRGNGILNQHIFKVVPGDVKLRGYIYTLLKYMKSTFARIAGGKQTTGLGHVTVKDLQRLQIVYPCYDILSAFSQVINPIVTQIINTNIENEILIKTRDSLASKLMSGEIRVPLNEEYPISKSSDLPLATESKAQYSST